jgi:hypothetical protein
MSRRSLLAKVVWVAFFSASVGLAGWCLADDTAPLSKSRIEAALQNVMTLKRSDQDGFATVWDGNKYVQCEPLQDRTLRCEAAGTLMQPSLDHVLTPERLSRLVALGWRLDPRFGNHVQTFPADATTSVITDKILQVLAAAYEADLDHLRVESTWVASEPCPPRNGPSQNLAGLVNNAPAMAATAIHACSYKPKPDKGPNLPANSAAELFDLYGARVTGEIQRLRVNVDRHVFAVFKAGIGYVQCGPHASPPTIYCEAQSADSWQALASILTPERVARLHAAGFADPGRTPNYWKSYSTDQVDDPTIAREVLTILHDVYGYTGLPELKVKTEDAAR